MLPGSLVKDVTDAFLDAFDDNTLNDLVRNGLSQRPAVIAAGPDLGVRVSNLLRWAERHGRVTDLIGAAIRAVPGNAPLAALRAKVAIASGTTEQLGAAMQGDVIDALRAMGLASIPRLDALATELDPILVDLLPRWSNEQARLVETFELLNRVARLGDGSIPLKTWLSGAASQGGPETALRVVQTAISTLAAREGGGEPITQDHFDKVVRRGREEKVVHQDDMLPVAFLRKGMEVGRSVCRLVVQAFTDGEASFDITGRPLYSFGSAWMITRDLLVTNHHVINARDPSVEDASTDDLALQARKTVAQFDYDADGAQTEEIPVKDLVAWSPRHDALDYAIVRLERAAVGRQPLEVVRTKFVLNERDPSRPAVNIIQHPGRKDGAAMTMYKMLACRNNLVFRTDGSDLWYFTDTLEGSSGSPVCNDTWQVVALHKRWGEVEKVSFQGKATAVANLGTQIYAILADLAGRAELRALHDEILAAQAAPV